MSRHKIVNGKIIKRNKEYIIAEFLIGIDNIIEEKILTKIDSDCPYAHYQDDEGKIYGHKTGQAVFFMANSWEEHLKSIKDNN